MFLQKLVKVTAMRNPAYDGCEWVLYVLAGHTLQKWVLIKGELERLVFECDINRFAVDAFHKTIGVSFQFKNCMNASVII